MVRHQCAGNMALRRAVITAMIGQIIPQPSAVRDVRQGGSAQKRQRMRRTAVCAFGPAISENEARL